MSPDEDDDLRGRVAVVTGSARGIGRTIAHTLAAAGAAVLISDLNDESGELTAAAIRADGHDARYLHGDVRLAADMSALASAAHDWHGRLDIWVHNAKADAREMLTDLSLEHWHGVLDVCLTGAFLGAKYAIPLMAAGGGGAIVTIASVHALAAYPRCAAYDAAKAGLVALTRQIAAEYGPLGIRANAILPGLILDPPGHDAHGAAPEVLERYPVGRVGTAQDVAGAVLYLASDAARFISGTSLVVDGGMTARSPEWSTHETRRVGLQEGDTGEHNT